MQTGKILIKKTAVIILFIAAFFVGRYCASRMENGTENGIESRTENGIESRIENGIESRTGNGIESRTENEIESRMENGIESRIGNGIESRTGSRAENEASIMTAAQTSWGLSFDEEGKTPTGNDSMEELQKYDTWYAKNTQDKILYLTFDCGYENGNTLPILEALKKHHAPAAFFVVGNYLKDNPDLIKQMKKEGHIIGNHTFHHPDMTEKSDLDSFRKELEDVETLYFEIVGQQIDRYYRPPQGKYSRENLKMAKQLGYRTILWSLAYVDWNQENQPTKEEAFEKLLKRIHPGAIVLLHNTSSTNGAILDELLTRWEEMGYSFGKLDEL